MDLESLRARQPQVVEEWFRGHADAVYTFAFYRVAKDGELANEVVQESFTTALRRINQYDPDRGPMLAWLNGIARNSITGSPWSAGWHPSPPARKSSWPRC